MNIINFLNFNESEMRHIIRAHLDEAGIEYENNANYIVTKSNGVRPLVCVHVDTCNHLDGPKKKEIKEKAGIISLAGKSLSRCLGADDRAGIWIALSMLRDGTATKFNYAFFNFEESGCLGSKAFIEHDTCSCFIGLDRRGSGDFATYGYDNEELNGIFKAAGLREVNGSFTDCSTLSEGCEKACLNLSVGYYNEHTKNEILDIEEMKETLQIMREIIIPDKIYEYEDKPFFYSGYSWENDDLDYYRNIINKKKSVAVLCDFCQDHAPLFETATGDMLCESCEQYVRR